MKLPRKEGKYVGSKTKLRKSCSDTPAAHYRERLQADKEQLLCDRALEDAVQELTRSDLDYDEEDQRLGVVRIHTLYLQYSPGLYSRLAL